MLELKIDNRTSDQTLFSRVFPEQVDAGDRKPTCWDWILTRIEDGNALRSPRNLIDLVNKGRDEQIRIEERAVRRRPKQSSLIEPESLKQGLVLLSEMRVNDTLRAENADDRKYVDMFENGKSEHNLASLRSLLKKKGPALDLAIKRLKDVGFLQEVGTSLKVPMLYRAGLNITQGKAF